MEIGIIKSGVDLIKDGKIKPYLLEYIVTGCPRSATLFMALLFRSANIPLNHEGLFGVPGGGFWLNHSVGDSSCFAVPFLGKAPEGCKIIHIVRDPFKVITGLKNWGFLDGDNWARCWFGILVKDTMPSILQYKGLDRYIHFYIGWNRTIEDYTKLRYRAEDLAVDPKPMFKDIGVELTGKEKLWNDEKTHTSKHKKYLTLEDFDNCSLRQDLKDYSEYLGY